MLRIFYLIVLLALSFKSNAQVSIKDSTEKAWLIMPKAAYYFPMADMKQRFGTSAGIGLSIAYKTKKNIIFGTENTYFFGNTINELTLLSNIADDKGLIVGNDGLPLDIIYLERGFMSHFNIGKIFNILNINKNSGLLFQLGLGLMQHKIKIIEKTGNTPALNKEYLKGYDRLSNGAMMNTFIGMVYFHPRKIFNLIIGIDANFAQTMSRRTLDYDTGLYNNTKRKDLLIGPKLHWVLPIYTTAERKIFYH